MAEKIKRRLQELKEHLEQLLNVSRKHFKKETSKRHTYSNPKRKTMEECRKEALDYLVKEYHESIKREEELRKKLEGYGRLRRWIYRKSMDLKVRGMVLKEVVIKPVGVTLVFMSGLFSWYLATATAPKIHKFIDNLVPPPLNKIVSLTTLPIGWTPVIILGGYYLYVTEKEINTRLKEDYGLKV